MQQDYGQSINRLTITNLERCRWLSTNINFQSAGRMKYILVALIYVLSTKCTNCETCGIMVSITPGINLNDSCIMALLLR